MWQTLYPEKLVSQWSCSENSVPTPIVTSNLILMGLTFLALSSFPPFSQSCHSLGQQREREKESTLCQLSRVTSALVLFGSNGNKLSESSECHESHKRRAHTYAQMHFTNSHTLQLQYIRSHIH